MMTSKSVLLIEDDKDDQEFFIDALKGIKNAALYYVANNGLEALAILKRSLILPDIIFSDIHMPLMDGIECLLQIKKDPKTKNIPVVILTTDTSRSELMYKLGARAFIQKPSIPNSLRGKLQHIINTDFCHP